MDNTANTKALTLTLTATLLAPLLDVVVDADVVVEAAVVVDASFNGIPLPSGTILTALDETPVFTLPSWSN